MTDDEKERSPEEGGRRGGGGKARGGTVGSSDEPEGRMAIGTSRDAGEDACAIADSASDRLITCGHGGEQGLNAQRGNGDAMTMHLAVLL
jgi:hypothetical protein